MFGPNGATRPKNMLWLAVRGHPAHGSETANLTQLDRTASTLLDTMGLLFVPAGVGIINALRVIGREWLPILAGLIGSTVLGLGLTGIIMHHVTHRSQSAPGARGAGAVWPRA